LAQRQQYFWVGFFHDQRKVRSSVATSSFSIVLIIWPMESRAAHRLILETTSLERTGSPSWNLSPSRSRKVQVSPSDETLSDSTICRCGCNLLSTPYSLSHTRSPALRAI